MFKTTLDGKCLFQVAIILVAAAFLVGFCQTPDQKTTAQAVSQKEVAGQEKKPMERSGAVDNAQRDKDKNKDQKQLDKSATPALNKDQEGSSENPDERRIKQAQDIIQDVFRLTKDIPNPFIWLLSARCVPPRQSIRHKFYRMIL